MKLACAVRRTRAGENRIEPETGSRNRPRRILPTAMRALSPSFCCNIEPPTTRLAKSTSACVHAALDTVDCRLLLLSAESPHSQVAAQRDCDSNDGRPLRANPPTSCKSGDGLKTFLRAAGTHGRRRGGYVGGVAPASGNSTTNDRTPESRRPDPDAIYGATRLRVAGACGS